MDSKEPGERTVRRDSERIFDEYLLVAVQAGDRRSWQRLVERWQRRLLAHARRLLGDADRARDAVQDAWIDIVRALPRLNDPAAFPAWAFQITTRRCLRMRRGLGQSAAIAFDDTEADVSAPTALSVSCAGEQFAEIAGMRRALATLPPSQQAALALFYLEGLGIAEISVALDVPPGTVKTRLMHARNKLRALLEKGDPVWTSSKP